MQNQQHSDVTEGQARDPEQETVSGATGHTPDPGNGESAAQDMEIARLRSELEQARDQTLRLRAEMDNMRKRGDRERADTARYAISKFAGDIISIADNLERALGALPGDASAEQVLEALRDGVRMTERELHHVLGRHGVHRIDPAGQAFDPHRHQAVMQQDYPTVGPGTVLRVLQAGYMIEDRVLRPAMVVVAAGRPKSAEAGGATEPVTADQASSGTAEAPEADLDELLDEALKLTFPASDPIAVQVERPRTKQPSDAGVAGADGQNDPEGSQP